MGRGRREGLPRQVRREAQGVPDLAGRRLVPVVVLAGQVDLDERTLNAAGVARAASLVDYAGSLRLAIDDAANQLRGLARVTAEGVDGWATRE